MRNFWRLKFFSSPALLVLLLSACHGSGAGESAENFAPTSSKAQQAVPYDASVKSVSAVATKAGTVYAMTMDKPLRGYKYIPGSKSATIVLNGTHCPPRGALAAVAIASPLCTEGNSGATMTFAIPSGSELTIGHISTGVNIAIIPIPKHRIIHPPSGPSVTSAYMHDDAEGRIKSMLRGSTAMQSSRSERRAQAGATSPPGTQIVQVPPELSAEETGGTLGTEEAFISRGGDDTDPTIYTRKYWFIYDVRTGALLKYGDEVVDDSIAEQYGFPPNGIPASGGGN